MNYDSIFIEGRARSYDNAMINYPFARKIEFNSLFRNFPLSLNEKILDIPSGGEYLQKLYPNNIVSSIEFSSAFNATTTLNFNDEWNLGQYDRIVCLAALHHIENLDFFMKKLLCCTYNSTIIHLADVEKDSKLSAFLDEFVDKHNPLGHRGYYRNWKDVIWLQGINILSIDNIQCPWKFDNIRDMISFCKNLFCIINCPDDIILSSLKDYIGYSYTEEGVILNWELTYVDLIKC
jgi:hypothetical protein